MVAWCRHSPQPLSLAVMSDRVVWTDGQYSDVLYSKMTEHDHRARITVGLFPLNAIITLEDNRSHPTGHMRQPRILPLGHTHLEMSPMFNLCFLFKSQEYMPE